jgi:chromate transporter
MNLLELTLAFARIGSLAFGGGGTTLAMMHQEFCVRRTLLTEEEFQVLFGLSRVVPGMNLLSLTVLLGHRTHGFPGSLAALVGLTVPSFTLIILGCWLFRGGGTSPYLEGAVRGLGPAAAALLAYTGWQLSRAALKGQSTPGRGIYLLLLGAAAALAAWTPLHPAWIILLGGLAGVLRARLAASNDPKTQ